MNQLGYYGKTPHRGDFVRFNLPQSFITVWDDWLRELMILGESQHTDWAERYASTTGYRFVLSSGIAGNTPWMGVLVASADKVGRRFPFCLAVSLSEQTLPCMALLSRSDWFIDAEELLQRVHTTDLAFDELQAELGLLMQRYASTDMTPKVPPDEADPCAEEQFFICMKSLDSHPADMALAPFLDTVLRQTVGEYSLWLSTDSQPQLLLSTGLPAADYGVALLTGDTENAATTLLDLSALHGVYNVNSATDPQMPGMLSEHASTGDGNAMTDALQSQDEDFASFTDSDARQSAASAENGFAAIESDTMPQADEQTPSADDWAALEEFEGDSGAVEDIIVPEVEPLELEEDDLPDVPWEK